MSFISAPVANIDEWVRKSIERHPEIESIELFGSRAGEKHHPNSDWDVLITLPIKPSIDAFVDDALEGYQQGIDVFYVSDGDVVRMAFNFETGDAFWEERLDIYDTRRKQLYVKKRDP